MDVKVLIARRYVSVKKHRNKRGVDYCSQIRTRSSGHRLSEITKAKNNEFAMPRDPNYDISLDIHITYSRGSLLPSQELSKGGIPCKSQADCKNSRLPSDAHCQSNFCICSDEKGAPKNCTEARGDAKAAVHDPGAAGQPCKMDQDCKFPNASCNTKNNQCECSSNFVMSSTTAWSCLPRVLSIGSNCEEMVQCAIGNSTCRAKQCLCNDGFHHRDNSCWRKIGFGGSCAHKEECNHVENAECNGQRVCACADHTVRNSDGERCLAVAKEMLDPCMETEQCTKAFGDSECIDKRCECKQNSHFEPSVSQCVASKNLGEACSASYECYQDREKGVGDPQRCVDKVCTCSEDFEAEEGKCVRAGVSSLVPSVFVTVLLARIATSTW